MIGVFPSWRGAADLEYQSKKHKTGRELFLERMEDLILWEKLLEAIKTTIPSLARGGLPVRWRTCCGCIASNSSTTSVTQPWSICSMKLKA